MKLLWIPHISWRVPQRAQVFCQELAKKHEVHVLTFEAFGSLRSLLSWRFLKCLFPREDRDHGVRVHWIPSIPGSRYSYFLRRFNRRLRLKAANRLIKKDNIPVVVGTYVCPPPKAPILIFDQYDDNVAYASSDSIKEEIARIEKRYREKADLILAASPYLYQSIKREGQRVLYVPNAIRLGECLKARGDEIRKQLGLTGVVAGAIGVFDTKGEVDKVLASAKAFPDVTFLIIGGGSTLPAARTQARFLPNVRFIPPVPQRAIAPFYAALDLGLCPYVITPGREAGFSMKALFYTAAKKPVVATAIRSLRELKFKNILLVEDSTESFIEGVSEALAKRSWSFPDLSLYDVRYQTCILESAIAKSFKERGV